MDRTVASVNGEIILYSDLQAQLLLMEKAIPELKTDDPTKKAEIEREALKQIIRQHLAEEEIKRQKITVSNSELESALESIKSRNNLNSAQFERFLKDNGQNLDQFKEGVKKDIERNKLVERLFRSKTVITDKQVDAALGAEKGDSVVMSRKLHLGIIFLPGTDKKSADESEKIGSDLLGRLRSGEDFAKLAKEYSKGPAVSEGGDVGFFAPEELAPHIGKAVQGLREGQVSDLVKGQGGYYIVKLYGVDERKQNKTSQELREKVRKDLFQKELDRKFEEWVRGLEEKAFIEITL